MPETFFHHTTVEGLKGIKEEHAILQSGSDVTFGEGVYLTQLGPDKSIKTVAANNFDEAASYAIRKGKLDVILKVEVSKKYVKRASTERNVYVHSGKISTEKIVAIYIRDKYGKAIKYKVME